MTKIKACKLWNRTPFELTEGQSYRFSAAGTWKDLRTPADACGYESEKLRSFESMRRLPEAKWFSLVGAIDKDKDHLFDIGALIESGGIYTAPTTGRLYCFANDVWFMYWNNSGAIKLSVEPVSG